MDLVIVTSDIGVINRARELGFSPKGSKPSGAELAKMLSGRGTMMNRSGIGGVTGPQMSGLFEFFVSLDPKTQAIVGGLLVREGGKTVRHAITKGADLIRDLSKASHHPNRTRVKTRNPERIPKRNIKSIVDAVQEAGFVDHIDPDV